MTTLSPQSAPASASYIAQVMAQLINKCGAEMAASGAVLRELIAEFGQGRAVELMAIMEKAIETVTGKPVDKMAAKEERAPEKIGQLDLMTAIQTLDDKKTDELIKLILASQIVMQMMEEKRQRDLKELEAKTHQDMRSELARRIATGEVSIEQLRASTAKVTRYMEDIKARGEESQVTFDTAVAFDALYSNNLQALFAGMAGHKNTLEKKQGENLVSSAFNTVARAPYSPVDEAALQQAISKVMEQAPEGGSVLSTVFNGLDQYDAHIASGGVSHVSPAEVALFAVYVAPLFAAVAAKPSQKQQQRPTIIIAQPSAPHP